MKPFDPSILRSKVRVFVDLYVKERQLREQSALLHAREWNMERHRTEERFRALLDAMPLCVWALGPDGAPTYANRSWINYAGAESTGLFAAVHADDAQRVRDGLAVALRARRSAGDRIPPALGARRALPLARGALRPTARSRRRRHQLDRHGHRHRKSQARRGRVRGARGRRAARARSRRGGQPGEGRVPRDAVARAAHAAQRHGRLGAHVAVADAASEKEQKALDTIERNARAQAELIEDILDVSRIITGKLRIELTPVDLQAIVDGAVDAVRPASDAKAIALDRRIGPLPTHFAGDATRLQQVVWNLLSNAIKFTPAGGRVELRLGCEDDDVVIEVRDSGCGIAPDFKPFVFDRFRQLDSSSRRTHGGLGLGLAIVRHVVELHGGTVSCDSDGEGQGATFRVRLPKRAPGPAAVAVAPETRVAGTLRPATTSWSTLTGIKVLLVDDEPDARDLLTEVLQQCGAIVVATHSADEALRLVQRERPAVLLSDIGLPGEDGYRLITPRARADRRARGAICRRGDHSLCAVRRRAAALQAGYQRHAPKPIQPTTLAALVAGLAQMGTLPPDVKGPGHSAA
jgi:signal transduction histidine kinase/CheY-like chemotaxis protein